MEKLSTFTLTDTQATLLWAEFREGNMEAFGTLMRGFYRPLFNYGRHITADRDILHDVIHDLFLHLWEARLSVSSTEYVRFYLFKSLKNRLISNKIDRDRMVSMEDPDTAYLSVQEESFEGLLIDHENEVINAKRLKNLVLQLSHRQQEVIHLRFYENLNNDQIADLMGINRQSVANLLHSGLERLRKYWHLSFALPLPFLLLRWLVS
jgi:RNA polymerase sigma factor (sigma-70 family)